MQPFLGSVAGKCDGAFARTLGGDGRRHTADIHSCPLHSTDAVGKMVDIWLLPANFKSPFGVVPDDLPVYGIHNDVFERELPGCYGLVNFTFE